MEYLHKHKEEFINAVNLASEYFHILPVIVEKREKHKGCSCGEYLL